MEKNIEFLYQYLNNASPTGFEGPGQHLWLDYLKPYVDTTFTDTYGTAVGVINPDAEFKVVIEAHADEISWFVHYINEQGYIFVRRNGGSDYTIAPSMRANLFTKKGIVKGVFGWPAIHVRKSDKEPKPGPETVFLDVGCSSKEEVEELGIHVGTVLTFEDELMELNDQYYCGRALDNRIGGYMIAEVARRMYEEGFKPDFGLYIVNAVQEEVGLKGAQMIAHRIKPDVAIVTDVTHDTSSPGYNKILSGDLQCGKGPVLTYGPAIQYMLQHRIIETAVKHGIAFQRAAASRATGTDTDAFAYSNEGVASALISLPQKYMHTTVEMVHKKDVEAIIKLMLNFLKELPDKHDFRYVRESKKL